MIIAKKTLALLLALLFSTAKVQAGDEVRNGADFYEFDNTAWFEDDRPINYCIDLADDFGLDNERAKNLFIQAVGIWDRYLRRNKIFKNPNDTIFFSSDFQYSSTCRGHEDLTVYLGSENQKIGTARESRRLNGPLGFAHLEDYSRDQGWGKGFIWIRKDGDNDPTNKFPDWSRFEKSLLGLFLHELGHVFGVGHATGTVMDRSIAEIIYIFHLSGGEDGTDLVPLDRIDGHRYLVSCEKCTVNKAGNLGSVHQPNNGDKEVFKRLIGRLPIGEIEAHLRMVFDKGHPTMTGAFTIIDQISFNQFEFTVGRNGLDYRNTSIFNADKGDTSSWKLYGAEANFGELYLYNGEKVKISVERNMRPGSLVSISEISAFQSKTLFSSFEGRQSSKEIQ